MSIRLLKHIRLLLTVALVAVVGMLHAQTSNLQFDRLFKKAFAQRYTKQGLQWGDSMLTMARQQRNRKEEVRAMIIPMHYYYLHKDDKKFDKWVATMQQKALQYNMQDYYYYALTNKIYYMVKARQFHEAVDYLREAQQYDKKTIQPYGIFLSYNMLGVIYHYQGDYPQALESFKASMDYAKKNLPKIVLESTYREMCACYRKTFEFEKLLNLTRQGLAVEKDEQTVSVLLVNKAYALFLLGKDMEFYVACNRLEKMPEDRFRKSIRVSNAVKTFKMIADGQYELAEKSIQALKDPEEREMALWVYYKRTKQYAKATQALREIYIQQAKANMIDVESSMADINAQIDRNVLETSKRQAENENTRLALQHAQLQLDKAALELKRSRDEQEIAKASEERNLLSYNYQSLLSRQLEDSLAHQRFRHDQQMQEMETQGTLLISTLAVFIIFVTLAVLYWRHNQRLSKRLRHTNEHLQLTHGQLEKANDEAQKADQLKTIFVQNMSHEIRTPLNAIVGFSNVLTTMGDDISEEEKVDLSHRILENSEMLSTLVNDILDLTSIESGRYEMKMQPVKANTICREAMDAVRQRLTPGVKLEFKTSLTDDAIVVVDRLRTVQVLVNLLSNAVKNTTEGSITLDMQHIHGLLRFVVTDTGVGVPPEKMDEIFERFKKLDAFKQGSGLGLYISRTIAEKMGGSVDIDRQYTPGARFVFTIPDRQA